MRLLTAEEDHVGKAGQRLRQRTRQHHRPLGVGVLVGVVEVERRAGEERVAAGGAHQAAQLARLFGQAPAG